MSAPSSAPSPKSRRRPGRAFLRLALGMGLALAAPALALALGVTPAMAAEFARQPDAWIAAFLAPTVLLVLALIVETARFVTRGAMPPARAPRPRRRRDGLLAPMSPRS